MPHLHPDPTVRTGPYLSDEARSALGEQAVRTPDWTSWLGLVEAALGEADAGDWAGVEIDFARARPEDAPLLEGARIRMDERAAARTCHALMAIASDPAASGSSAHAAGAMEPVGLLEAGVCQDAERIAGIARAAGLPAPLLATVAHFYAMPVLLEAAHRATSAVPPGWSAGYCPVCGGWPTLAEVRGLERRRVLRCGRCATGWEREVLRCTFCGERDHRRQGALVPEDGGELVRIETCHSCQGYLKAVTTLGPKPVWALLLEDLRTLPLELKATERGFGRPARPGWTLATAVTPRPEAP